MDLREMLSYEKIIAAIKDNNIEVKSSFGMVGNELKYFNKPKSVVGYEKNYLYSDRIKLTLGPVLKVLNQKTVKKKNRFKNFENCYDLRTSDNKYLIMPGESVIILTNEYIKLSGKYACIVVPRISLSDVGIVVSTAYVDPYYQGLLRLHLTNMSKRPYELTAVEAIAQCFFFELTGEVPARFKEEFSVKSVFYGQTWKEIIDSDRNPFPTKKESINNKWDNLKYQISLIKNLIIKHSIIVFAVTNISILFGGYKLIVDDVNEYKGKMEQISTWLTPESCEIKILSGESEGKKEITINCPKADIVSVLINDDKINYEISSGNEIGKTVIKFSCELPTPVTTDYIANFSYVIVKRMK